MDPKCKPEPASLETILGRLTARNAQLDRELEALLTRIGLARQALDRAGDMARRYAPERLARASQQIETRLDTGQDLQWEQLRRPTVEQLSRSFGARLVRV